jgi:hypothetical protein
LTLETAIPLLERAAGGPVDGMVGEAHQFDAVQSALQDPGFDEVIISTLPKRVFEWLRRDLPHRVERTRRARHHPHPTGRARQGPGRPRPRAAADRQPPSHAAASPVRPQWMCSQRAARRRDSGTFGWTDRLELEREATQRLGHDRPLVGGQPRANPLTRWSHAASRLARGEPLPGPAPPSDRRRRSSAQAALRSGTGSRHDGSAPRCTASPRRRSGSGAAPRAAVCASA